MEQLIVEYAEAGEAALREAPLDAGALDLLRGLARDATQRTA
jgi:geranylgeranyl diphosphate synthase type I